MFKWKNVDVFVQLPWTNLLLFLSKILFLTRYKSDIVLSINFKTITMFLSPIACQSSPVSRDAKTFINSLLGDYIWLICSRPAGSLAQVSHKGRSTMTQHLITRLAAHYRPVSSWLMAARPAQPVFNEYYRL